MHLRLATLATCATLAPTWACASIHADPGSSGVLNVLFALLASLAVLLRLALPLMLVTAVRARPAPATDGA